MNHSAREHLADVSPVMLCLELRLQSCALHLAVLLPLGELFLPLLGSVLWSQAQKFSRLVSVSGCPGQLLPVSCGASEVLRQPPVGCSGCLGWARSVKIASVLVSLGVDCTMRAQQV